MTSEAQGPVEGGSRPANPEEAEALRRRAEERARVEDTHTPAGSSDVPLTVDEATEMLHELRVHQIEIEMQNEELRRTQAELLDSRERYFELYDMAPVAYLTIGKSGQILEVNLTAVSLLGENRSALVGLPFTRFIRPASQDTYYRHQKDVAQSGSTHTCELEMLRADGSVFVGRVVATPVAMPDGSEVSRVVVSDVTELRDEEARRLDLEHRLHQTEKVESLGRMAGAIAHHFNNLLAVMIGNLELVMSDPECEEAADERLDDALAAARSAAQVSGMLLSYVGQTNEEQRPRDLSEVIHWSLAGLRAAVPGGVELEEDLPSSGGPMVGMNAPRIEQVVQNLVTNAVEAMGADSGTVQIAVRELPRASLPEEDRFPQDWTPSAERYAVLSVTDSGPGIDRHHVEQIFEPFFSSKEFGRGLGLSVALGTVRAHDGAIAVKPLPAGGTTMEVWLPVSDQPRVAPPEPSVPAWSQRTRSAAPQPSQGVVLLVDDEPMLRSLGSRMLSRLGFEVITAGDGPEGVRLFDEHLHRITCVICDVTMPKMSGWETLEALRDRSPGVPVVLTSGFDEAHVMSGDHPERPQSFISKPWSGARLQTAIETAIG